MKVSLPQAVAGAVLAVMLAVMPPPAAAQQRNDIDAIFQRFQQSVAAGNFTAALGYAQRLEAAVKARQGVDNQTYAATLTNLALVLTKLNRLSEAESTYKRALAILEKLLGKEFPELENELKGLVNVYEIQGQFAAAVPLVERLTAILEREHGAGHDIAARARSSLAFFLAKAAAQRFREKRFAGFSEEYAVRAYNLFIRTSGGGNPGEYFMLALVMQALKAQDKQQELDRGVDRLADLIGRGVEFDDPAVAYFLGELAHHYRKLGRSVARVLVTEAIRVYEKVGAVDNADFAAALHELAIIERLGVRYEEAELLFRRVLAILDKLGGPKQESYPVALADFANVLLSQGRVHEAIQVYRQAVGLLEARSGRDDPALINPLRQLAVYHQLLGELEEAQALNDRVLRIAERSYGRSSVEAATALSQIGRLSHARNRLEKAADYLKEAIAIQRKVGRARNDFLAMDIMNLAEIYIDSGKNSDAGPLIEEARAMLKQLYEVDYGGAISGSYPTELSKIGELLFRLGRTEEAYAEMRRSGAMLQQRNRGFVSSSGGSRGDGDFAFQSGDLVTAKSVLGEALARVALRLADEQPARKPELAREVFEAVQWSALSGAGNALGQMAARFAAEQDGLATLVRDAQDLAAARRETDRALVATLSAPAGRADRAKADALRRELAAIESKLAAIPQRLEKEYPDYAALANPKPLERPRGPGVARAPTRGSFLAGRRQRELRLRVDARAVRVEHDPDWDAKSWRDRIADPTRPRRGRVREVGRGPQTATVRSRRSPMSSMRALLGPIEALVKDKRQLLVVPSGPLTALPFHLLVTDKPVVRPSLRSHRPIATPPGCSSAMP